MGSTTGYIENVDPLETNSYGYRSGALRRPNSFFATDSVNSYNGFHFPPLSTCKATIVPEYDKTGRTVKHLVVAITVEFIVSKWNTLSSAQPTIDEEMEEIRKRLMQPGQDLSFYLQGLGNIIVNSTSLDKDVNFGPKPQVFDWQPIAGALAARGEWLCVTWISPTHAYGGFSPSVINGLSEFGYEEAWDTNEQGFLTRVVTCEAEASLARFSSHSGNTAQNVLNLAGTNATFDRLITAIKTTFPRLEGFHRVENTHIDKAKKRLKYVITDEEIRSDQIYPKGVIDLDFREELSSSFEERAFTLWEWSFSATASVPNAGVKGGASITQNKNLAFNALVKLIRKKLDYIKGKVYIREGASVEDVEAYRRNVAIIPSKIKVGNDTFNNSISLDMSFTLFCTAELVFAATGMYDSINQATGWKWKDWVDHLEKTGVDDSVVNMVPEYEVIVDLVHPLTNIGPTPKPVANKDTTIRVTTKADIFGPEIENKESSWIEYRNNFYFLDRNFTTVGTVTSGSAEEEQESASGNPASSTTDTGDNQKEKQESSGTDSKRGKPELQTSSEPIHYVTMVGSAIRVGFPIEAPKLISVGKANAKLTGDNIVRRSTMPSGWQRIASVGGVTQRLGTVNIYKLSWRKTYVLDDAPSGWKVTTTGEPQQFL